MVGEAVVYCTHMARRMLKSKRIIKKRRAVRAKPRARGILDASALGIDTAQVLQGHFPAGVGSAVLSGGTLLARPVSPVENDVISRMHQPLLSARTSFWLGVGFGMLVVGILAFLAWQLFQVELRQVGVVG